MYIETSVAIAITVAAGKGFDALCSYFSKKTKEETVDEKIEKIQGLVSEVNEILKKHDDNSIPLIYTPREIFTSLKEIHELVKTLSHTSEVVMPKALDKLASTLESMTLVLARIEDRSSRK